MMIGRVWSRVRWVLFWLHLSAGVVAGLFVLLMSVTGVLLAYELQITAWAERDLRVAAADAEPMSAQAMLTQVAAGEENAPTNVTWSAAPGAPVKVAFGRERTLFVDPYTGKSLGEGARRLRGFFQTVTDLHRWLALAGDWRPVGKGITGAANLAFLFILLSGPVLWLPRAWTWAVVRAAIWFRGGLRGKARDWNWHNTIGLWCVVPLLVIVISGATMSYGWARDLVTRAAGGVPPPPEARPAARAEARPEARGEAGGRGAEARGETGGRGGEGAGQARGSGAGGEGARGREGGGAGRALQVEGLDKALAQARGQVGEWRTITLRLGGGRAGPWVFTIDQGSGRQPQRRGELTIDRKTGETVSWKPFAEQARAQQVRTVLRFSHTGEIWGVLGQTLAAIASAGAAVLVYTGFALTWRRFFGRRAVVATEPSAAAGLPAAK